MDECIAELKAFVRGGEPGLERLHKVYPSIIKHFGVKDRKMYYYVMHMAGVPSSTLLEWKVPQSLGWGKTRCRAARA
jgi:hypothetical protein